MAAKIFMTGGSGRLGTELRRHLEVTDAPDERALDITDAGRTLERVRACAPDLILHLAAFTDVRAAETNRRACWQANVVGTRHVARAASAVSARLVHISTDYVFAGDRGMYQEDDPLGPPANYYALTKLVSEEVARVADGCLIVRTSFRPRKWPYPTAFTDVYTSQDYIDVIAPMIAKAVVHLDRIDQDTLHIATERKTIYELARRRAPDVTPTSCSEAGVTYPKDVSLDTSRWAALQATWSERPGGGPVSGEGTARPERGV